MADLRWLREHRTLIGVLHTTEGDTVEAAWRTLGQQNAAPHFIAGEHTIVQCRPLNVEASTLRPRQEQHRQRPSPGSDRGAEQADAVAAEGGDARSNGRDPGLLRERRSGFL